MKTGTKLLIGWTAVEIAVTAWIGYSIATARERPWDISSVKPKKATKRRNPESRRARGARRRVGVSHVSQRDAMAGTIRFS